MVELFHSLFFGGETVITVKTEDCNLADAAASDVRGKSVRGACFLFGSAFSVKSSRLNRDQGIHTKTVRREKIASIYGTLRYYCTFGVYAPLDVCYALLFQHDFFFLRLFLSFNNEECFSS